MKFYTFYKQWGKWYYVLDLRINNEYPIFIISMREYDKNSKIAHLYDEGEKHIERYLDEESIAQPPDYVMQGVMMGIFTTPGVKFIK